MAGRLRALYRRHRRCGREGRLGTQPTRLQTAKKPTYISHPYPHTNTARQPCKHASTQASLGSKKAGKQASEHASASLQAHSHAATYASMQASMVRILAERASEMQASKHASKHASMRVTTERQPVDGQGTFGHSSCISSGYLISLYPQQL